MQTVSLTIMDGTLVTERAVIAKTFLARLVGLLNRRNLDTNEALLLQPGGSIHTFGMRFSIDVLFLDRHMNVLRACSHIKPWRSKRAPFKTRSVLELPAGTIEQLGITRGMRLIALDPMLAPRTGPS